MIPVKIFKKAKATPSSSRGSSSGISTYADTVLSETAKEALHANTADEATHASEAAHAALAKNLDPDSSDWQTIDNKDLETKKNAISETLTETEKRYLSKLNDDSTAGKIIFQKGFESDENSKFKKDIKVSGGAEIGNGVLIKGQSAEDLFKTEDYVSGSKGLNIWRDGRGRICGEIDKLTVRLKAIFAELEIRRKSFVGGNLMLSPAGSKIISVEKIVNTDTNAIVSYKCFFKADDGTTATTNTWKKGDLAVCQTFNIKEGTYKDVSNRYYWRLVIDAGDGYITLGNGEGQYDAAGTDEPLAGDVLVMRGNNTDTDRQSVIEFITGDSEPKISMTTGISGFTIGDEVVRISPSDTHFSSRIFRITDYDGQKIPIVLDKGAWDKDTTYYYYNRVSYNGSLWLLDGIAQGSSVKGVEPVEKTQTQWSKQVNKGDDGEKGDSEIIVTVYSDTGNVIRNGSGTIQLTAVVTSANVVLTNIPDIAYNWKRTSTDTKSDTGWNSRHEGAGKSITVTQEDIFRQAMFEVDVDTAQIKNI